MKKLNIFVVLSLFNTFFAMSQGCSDAGFCTIDNLQVSHADSTYLRNTLKMGLNLGAADNDVAVFGSYLEYSRSISKVVDVDLKVNFMSQSGNSISSSALSDLFLVSNYKLNAKTKATFGLKIPLTDGNLKKDGFSLPMDYQPSLGTLDLIVGVSRSVDKFSFVLAYQQPLTQNKNQFFAPIGSDFITTNNYKRAGDVLFRASYLYKLNDKFSLSPSLLPIYHLQNDKFTDVLNVERAIDDSQGLTLNANVYLNYKLNATSALEFSLGSPLVVRKQRPDGLTRSFVANLEYKFMF